MTQEHRGRGSRSLFRKGAVERYVQGREAAVLPRFVLPRTLVFLWLLFALLIGSGCVAWSTRVPVFDTGPAIVAKSPGDDDVILVALFPPNRLPQLKVGEAISLTSNTDEGRVRQPITAVMSDVLSPTAVIQRFDLSMGVAAHIKQPAAVAMARFRPPTSALDASTYLGSVYQAEVEVGSRRVISLLPVIGQFLGAP